MVKGAVARKKMNETEITRNKLIAEERQGEWSSDYDSENNLAPCPRCKNARSYVRTSRPAEFGYRVRYHVCPICKLRFKSIEIIKNDVV